MRPARGWRRRKSPLFLPLILAAGLGMVLATPSAGTTRAQLVLEETNQLSNSPTRDSRNPRLVVTGGGTVFVAWEEEGATQAGLNDIHFRFLQPGPGATWLPPTAGTAARFAQSPALATYAGDEVGLVFESVYPVEPRQIQLKQWNPTARRWPLVPNALNGVGVDGVEPDLAFQPDGTLWLTWVSTHDGGRRPYYARMVNGTVREGGTIPACFSFDAFWPRIAVAADQDSAEAVHAVWSNDQSADGASIQHAYRSLGESEWTCNDNEFAFFDSDPVHQRLPDIAATGRDNVCMVWQEGDGPLVPTQKQDIIRTCAPWTDVINASDSGARAVAPNIALAPNALGIGALIMWEQQQQQTRQVWFSRSTPPLKAPVRGNSRTPDIALDPLTGTVHAVWSEGVGEGGSEIFYARWSALPPSTTPTATATPRATRTPSPTASGSATVATPVATTATATLTATLATPGRTPTPSATPEITPTPPEGTTATATPTGTASQASATSPTPAETDTPEATATPRDMKIYLAIAHRAPPSPE